MEIKLWNWRRETDAVGRGLDLYSIRKRANHLFEKIGELSLAKKLSGREKNTQNYIMQVFPRENRERKSREIWGKRIAVSCVGAAVAAVSALWCFFSEPESSPFSDGKYIKRGEADEVVELQLSGISESVSFEKKISLNVRERRFSAEEKKLLTEETEKYLQAVLPGKNGDLSAVSSSLNLVESIPDSGILVEWTYDDTYMRASGSIRQDAIPGEGVDTELMAKAVWKNWKAAFHFPVHLVAGKLSEKELAVQKAEKAVKEVMRKQADKEVVELPGAAGDISLSYQVEETKDYMLFYVSLLAVFLLPVLISRKQKRAVGNREVQLLMDYPVLVNRVMLLLGAGLTVRRTMERLSEEYEENRKNGAGIRYVYEEICIMVQHMRDGSSESQAVEGFGRRCGLIPYLRFSSVISQNLKKGAEGIIEILEKESLDALEQRKERVLQAGEVAASKLLFPMILMLCLVMVIIMVPAFMTM